MSKKFGVSIQQTDDGFVARVIRRRTSCGTVVEREHGGFADRASAEDWGDAALAAYLADRRDRNARKTANRRAARERRHERHVWLAAQTLQKLAEISDTDRDASALLEDCAGLLWSEVAFRALKRGETEDAAVFLADTVVGKNWTQRLAKAMKGDLDHVHEAIADMALANAVRLSRLAQEGQTE